jgi:hypothetical protein
VNFSRFSYGPGHGWRLLDVGPIAALAGKLSDSLARERQF